jgi:hypothetical protein
MGVGTAHRITIDPFGLDMFAPAALDRVVHAQHDRTRGHKAPDQQRQQKTACFPATPASTAQHTVIVDEVAITAAAHNP